MKSEENKLILKVKWIERWLPACCVGVCWVVWVQMWYEGGGGADLAEKFILCISWLSQQHQLRAITIFQSELIWRSQYLELIRTR